MKEYEIILKLASECKLPSQIDGSCGVNLDSFLELYNQGYMTAIDVSSDDGNDFLEPKITLLGREYLEELSLPRKKWWYSMDRRLAVWGIVVALLSIIVSLFLTVGS